MPILYDKQGKPAKVPEEKLQEALASGYTFPKGKPVVMKGPAGEVLEGPAEEVSEMLNRGYSLESSAETEERELQEEYGGPLEQVATFAHGAANSMSFGVVDQIGAAIGGKDYTDPVKKMKQANPDADLTGSIAGVALPFIVTGGQSAAMGTLGKMGAGVRKVGRVGRKVEKALLPKLAGPNAGMVRQSLARAGSLGTGAGVEGAVYGLGQYLSEEALGETEATAENLLGHMKMGAMWGGIGGAGMGAGGEILKRGLGAGARFSKRSSEGVVSMWEKATGNKAVDGVKDRIDDYVANPKVGPWSKVFGPAIGEPAENLARFTQKGAAGKEARRLGMKSAKELDTHVTSISDDLDKFDDVFEGATEQMMGPMKIKNMKSIKTVKNEVGASTEALGLIDDATKEIQIMLDAGDDIAGATYSGAARGRLNDTRKSLARHKKDLEKALLKGGDNVGGDIHGIVDSIRRDIGLYRNQLKGLRKTDLGAKDIFNQLEETFTGFQKHLEKVEFYGAVGKAQSEFNPIWSRAIGRSKTKMARKLREKVGEAAWRDVYATNRGSVDHMIKDMGRAKNKNMEDFFVSQLDDKLAFIKKTRETFEELPEGLAARLDTAEGLANQIKNSFKKAQKEVTLQNQVGDIISKSSGLQSLLPMGAGAGIGYVLGGEEGMALGLGLSVMTNPGKRIQLLAALDRMSSKTELGVVKAIKGYIQKATGKAKPLARGMIAPASLKILGDSNWGEKRTKDKNKYEAFRRRSDELTEFLSNPEKTMDRLKTNVGEVSDVAPNIATAMQVKAVQAARYLYDRMPKPLTNDTLLSGKFKPSDLELAKFERIAAVIDNPENALKSLNAGTLTVEEVEALKANYPEMYEQIVTTLAEQIPELREDLPYKERVQLSILFEVPVDATMEPEFLVAMQSINMIPPMQPGQTPGPKQPKSKVGQYDDLSIDKASMSSTQRVEMNKLT